MIKRSTRAGLEVFAERWLSLPRIKRLEEICLTVVVVGNAVVDIAYQVERLPGPGETVLARERTVDVGGKGLNQTIMAHRAGAEVRFCAPLGGDLAAGLIRACLETKGMSTAWLVSVPCATDESIICVARSGENWVVSTDEAARHLAPADVDGVLMEVAPGDVLLLQGNLSREVTGLCLTRGHAAGATTILNPAPIAFDYASLWPLVDIAILNEIEAQTLTGEVHAAAAAALRNRGVNKVVLTLGPKGALVHDATAPPQHLPAPTVIALDTTGAGDVLAGVVAAAVDRGVPLTSAVRWAVAAASLKVSRHGTGSGLPTSDELAALAPVMDLP
jgi:ribokinase